MSQTNQIFAKITISYLTFHFVFHENLNFYENIYILTFRHRDTHRYCCSL